MKVGATTGQLLASAGQRSGVAAPTSTSFAELLASGRSVSSIRSQRAFSFSETGLLGASRPVEVTGSARARQITETLPNFVRQPANSGHIVDRPQARSGFGKAAVSDGQREMPISGIIKFRSSVETQGTVVTPGRASRNVGNLGNYSAKIDAGSPFILAERLRLDKKRKRALSLSGPDDGLIISIGEFDNDDCQDMELFSAFFSISRQFGMTLSSIRFNKEKFNLNFESGRV